MSFYHWKYYYGSAFNCIRLTWSEILLGWERRELCRSFIGSSNVWFNNAPSFIEDICYYFCCCTCIVVMFVFWFWTNYIKKKMFEFGSFISQMNLEWIFIWINMSQARIVWFILQAQPCTIKRLEIINIYVYNCQLIVHWKY